MAITLDDAIERERHNLGGRILDHDETGLGGPDLGKRGGHRAGKIALVTIAACACGLPVATASTRSASRSSGECSSTQDATSGWSAARPRITGGGACSLNASTRELRAHQWRWIVKQHDQRAFGGGAIIGREIGIEIGAGQSARGVARSAAGAVRIQWRN
jgi:hypothetical protein